MASFNKVIFLGNLTRDPELRYTAKGTAVANVSMAANRVWTDDAGQKKEEVVFVTVDIFGRMAENVGQYMKKGSSMLVEGRLKLDQWDDKQTGQKRSKLGIVAESVQFLSSPKTADGGVARPAQPAAARQTSPAAAPASDEPPLEGDDVPFMSNNSGSWFASVLRVARSWIPKVVTD